MANVRINEFPPLGESDVLSGSDRVPMWHADTNKTVYVDLSTLRVFILSGGEAVPMPPVVNGASLIVTITEVEEGTQRVDIPDIAGKNFVLRRRGQGAMKPGIEYNALSSGGFELLTEGDILQDEEVFEVDVFNLQGGTPSGQPSSGGSMITGVLPVSTNQTLTADHLNQLIQLRAGADNVITLTLPSITDIPENTIIPIESLISNNRQHRIQTQGGQYIYLSNTSTDHLYIGLSEYIHLLAGSDGWYPVSFSGNFSSVGEIVPGYTAGLNMYQLNSGTISPQLRASYPRLWEKVQTFGSSLVTDSVWLTASVSMSNPTRTVLRPYRGCFSLGDGTTTFRFPDFQGTAIRGLNSGSDSQRSSNIPGNYQDDMYESHGHGLPIDGGGSSDLQSLTDSANADERLSTTILSGLSGGAETRMENIGLNWYIKI